MKPLIITIVFLIIAVPVWMLIRIRSVSQTTSTAPHTLEEKLAALQQCGLQLSQPFTKEDLLESMDRSDYEEPGWEMVMMGLGIEEEREPFRPHCKNLWCFDTECISDHGDYKRIVERMVEMSQGSLPLKDIKDFVDVENGEAWVSFKLNGVETKLDCKVEDDWVDVALFPKIDELLQKTDSSKVFFYYDTGGQQVVIGCVTKNQLAQIRHLGVKL